MFLIQQAVTSVTRTPATAEKSSICAPTSKGPRRVKIPLEAAAWSEEDSAHFSDWMLFLRLDWSLLYSVDEATMRDQSLHSLGDTNATLNYGSIWNHFPLLMVEFLNFSLVSAQKKHVSVCTLFGPLCGCSSCRYISAMQCVCMNCRRHTDYFVPFFSNCQKKMVQTTLCAASKSKHYQIQSVLYAKVFLYESQQCWVMIFWGVDIVPNLLFLSCT